MNKGLGPIRTVEMGIRNGLPTRETEHGLEGIAWGGPKHGIKLTAGLRWDGAVALTKAETKAARLPMYYQHFHCGYYRWEARFSFTDYTWVWVPTDKPAKKPIRREGTHAE